MKKPAKLIALVLTFFMLAACGSDIGIPQSGSSSVSIVGVVATGAPAANAEIRVTVLDEDEIWKQMEGFAADAQGAFMIPDILGKMALLDAFIKDPSGKVTDILKSVYVRDDSGGDRQVTNINKLTDVTTKIALDGTGIASSAGCGETLTYMGQTYQIEDSYSYECLLNKVQQEGAPETFSADVEANLPKAKRGLGQMLGGMMPEGADPFTDTYVANPNQDELDALQERIDLRLQPGATPEASDIVVVTNSNGETIAQGDVASLLQSEDPIQASSIDEISEQEQLDAILVRGGFAEATGGSTEPDGTDRYLCFKEFRDENGIGSATEQMCVDSPATCSNLGAISGSEPFASQQACELSAQQTADQLAIYLSSTEAGQDTVYATVEYVSSFTPGDIRPGLNSQEACAAGYQPACVRIPANLTCTYNPDHQIRVDGVVQQGGYEVDWNSVPAAGSYYFYRATSGMPAVDGNPFYTVSADGPTNFRKDYAGGYNWVVTAVVKDGVQGTFSESAPSNIAACGDGTTSSPSNPDLTCYEEVISETEKTVRCVDSEGIPDGKQIQTNLSPTGGSMGYIDTAVINHGCYESRRTEYVDGNWAYHEITTSSCVPGAGDQTFEACSVSTSSYSSVDSSTCVTNYDWSYLPSALCDVGQSNCSIITPP